jgi:hypothetical protein
MDRLVFASLFALSATVMFSACSRVPSGVLPQFGPTASLQRGHSIAYGSKGLSGVIKTKDFIVKAGQTETVTGNLGVFASDKIEVDGTLRVRPGVTLGLFSKGFVTINGIITSASASASQNSRASHDVMPAPASAPIHVFVVGDNTNIGEDSKLDEPKPGEGIAFVTTTSGGQITLGGSMELPNGADGTDAADPGTPGGAQPGGSVEIGTQSAIDLVKEVSKQFGQTITAAAPAKVEVTGTIHAGNGGRGFSDVNGKRLSPSQLLTAGDGAHGGDVVIVAKEIVIRSGATVTAGDGGDGGYTGYDPVTGKQFNASVDGQGPDHAGLNLVAHLGKGGDGGKVSLRGNDHGVGHAGSGGSAGELILARAGNGLQGAAGGFTDVEAAIPGMNGDGKPAARNKLAIIDLRGGGSGAPGTDPKTPGGPGGSVAIDGPKGFQVQSLDFQKYANGGSGFNGCNTKPTVSGSNGGNSQGFNNPGKLTYKIPFNDSFNGGAGGDGSPVAGSGGTAGTDSATGAKIGTDGSNGKTCPLGAAILPHRNNVMFDEFEENGDGSLTGIGSLAAGGNGDAAASDPKHPFVYIAYSTSQTAASIETLSLAYASGGFSPLNTVSTDTSPLGIATDGTYLYTINETVGATSGSIDFYAVGTSGLSALSTKSITYVGLPTGIAVDGKFAFVADQLGLLMQYGRQSNGTLTLLTPLTFTSPATDVFDNAGKSLYVALPGAGAIAQYSIGPTGTTVLSPGMVAAGSSTALPTRLLCVNGMCFLAHPADNKIYQYAISSSGALTPLSSPWVMTIAGPSALSVDASGTHLYDISTTGTPTYQVWNIGSTGLASAFSASIPDGTPVGLCFVAQSPSSGVYPRC